MVLRALKERSRKLRAEGCHSRRSCGVKFNEVQRLWQQRVHWERHHTGPQPESENRGRESCHTRSVVAKA
jgi:hypothetical protein